MSHFTVLVIGENPEKQLAPYHEYECTGIDDEYVIDVDKTEEVEEWKNAELFVGRNAKDELDWHKFEEKAKRDFGVSYRKMPRTQFLKEKGIDLEEEINSWFGYEKKDGRYYRHTNPNSKWDWYQIGGRWSDMLKLKENATGEKGERSWTLRGETSKEGYCDSALKKDIDFEGMMNEDGIAAGTKYEKLKKLFGGSIPKIQTWEETRKSNEGLDIDKVRALYWDQEGLKKQKELSTKSELTEEEKELLRWEELDDYQCTKEEFIQRARDGAITTYAVIKDGEWFAKGDMGWFGCSSETEEEAREFDKGFYDKFIKNLPEDTRITVVDCHI